MSVPDPNDSQAPSQVPQSTEAEEGLLGCVLINPDAYYEVCDLIVSLDFYSKKRQWVWDAFVLLVDAKTPIDLLTVSEELDRVGHLDQIGGFAYLNALINQCPSSLNAVAYARIIEGCSIRRKMIQKANKIASIAYDESKLIEDALSQYDAVFSEQQLTSSATDDTEDSDDASLALIERITSKTPTGVLSYFPEFDKYDALGGFPMGGTLLMGDSSFGKSAVALQICEQNALAGNQALYIGLESTNAQMVIRRVAGASGVVGASKKLRTASLTAQEEEGLLKEIRNNYQGKYKGKLKLNSRATTIRQIENAIRKHKPKICVIDQISQVTDMPSTNPTMNLLMNFARLKALGNKYNCAVIVVHAISPEESRVFFKKNQKSSAGKVQKNGIPNINAIPWASQMKFLADVILFLVPEVNQKLSGVVKYEIIIWVMKDRDGTRFTDCWFNYDLVMQWFESKPAPYKSSAQRPSSSQSQVPMVDYSIEDEPEFDQLDFDTVK